MFGAFFGSIAILILLAGVIWVFVRGIQIRDPVWIVLSALALCLFALPFLFGGCLACAALLLY